METPNKVVFSTAWGVTLTIPVDRLPQFTLLKLLHNDGVHSIQNEKLTTEIARDIEHFINTGYFDFDDTLDVLELLGYNVNDDYLPRDMIKIHLKEEYLRNLFNTSTYSGNNFDCLIELTEKRYNRMKALALEYQNIDPKFLRCKDVKYPDWFKIKHRIRKLQRKLAEYGREMIPQEYYEYYMIAGGLIASIVHDKPVAAQDVDVFIATSDPLVRENIGQYYADIRNQSVTSNDKIISLSITNRTEVQIIKRFYKVFDQVLHGFDVDASCIGLTFDGKLWMTQRFEYAFMKNCLTVNINRLSSSYEYRLAKYYRRGWDLYVPGTLTQLVPSVEIEFDDGNMVKFSEIDLQLNSKWFAMAEFFDNLSDDIKEILISKLRRRWRHLNGIDILWIATRPRVVLDGSYYSKRTTYGVNGTWIVDKPDTQHTGSFNPVARTTKWFEFTIEKHLMSYLPLARIMAKYNLYNIKLKDDYLSISTYWRVNRIHKFEKHGEVVYVAEFMIQQFKRLFGLENSDFIVTDYISIMNLYSYINYVMDTKTEIVVGSLEKSSYGSLINVCVSPTREKINSVIDIPKFIFCPKIRMNYPPDYLIDWGPLVQADYMYNCSVEEKYEYYLSTGELEYIMISHRPKFVDWFSKMIKQNRK